MPIRKSKYSDLRKKLLELEVGEELTVKPNYDTSDPTQKYIAYTFLQGKELRGQFISINNIYGITYRRTKKITLI